MKKTIVIPFMLLTMVCNHSDNTWQMPENSFELHKRQVVAKVIQIESNGRHDAVGDGGRAIGVLQIWPIMVDEVNRLIGREEFTYDDRWDSLKSVQMFMHFQDKVNPEWDEELAVRKWNGGIRGERNPKTLVHYEKYKKL